MFETTKTLILKGKSFKTEKELGLLNDRLNIIYGRNGSGKTTIGDAFECIKDSSLLVSRNLEKSIFKEAIADDSPKKDIYIFNEEFIRNKISIKDSDGIGAIVMLGEQADLDRQIEEKNKELDIENKNLAALNEKKEKLENKKDPTSPDYHKEQIEKILKGRWAAKDGLLRGNRKNSSVNDIQIEKIQNLELQIANTTKSALETAYSTLDKQYTDAKENSPITFSTNNNSCNLNIDLNKINNLIHQELCEPNLSLREEHILNILKEKNYMRYVEDSKTVFNSDVDFCPLCFHSVDSTQKNYLKETIERILNEEVKKFQEVLQNQLLMCQFNNSYKGFENFAKKFYEEDKNCKDSLKKLESSIQLITSAINQRLDNIYDNKNVPEIKDNLIKHAQENYNQTLEKLQKKIDVYNDNIQNANELKKKLLELNDKIAYFDCCSLFPLWQNAKLAKKENIDQINKSETKKIGLESAIKGLEQKKNKVEIAQDFINEALAYVFFDKKHLKLVPGTGCYQLTTRGERVKPDQISIGERNVIALCYYFAEMFAGKEESEKYKTEKLLVIDDPISSFDLGNRVGVISLLRWQFNENLTENKNTKILVMSHDLMTVFDLCKVKKELLNLGTSYKELKVGENLIDRSRNRSEYSTLLNEVYEYANRTSDDYDKDSSIGNIMRRVLEAYCSFNYCAGFENIMRNAELLESIPENKRTYYENLMTRLVLNGESHREEATYSLMPDAIFSNEEKRKTAKSILLFLYYLDPLHLKAFLNDKSIDRVAVIEQWKNADIDTL